MIPDLEIVGVIEDDVGEPRDDGTRGSALYEVPIRLNRKPDSVESRLLVEVWNAPPRYTTMHRPGILRVRADRIVLDGTTIDEVARYHAATLRLVIDDVTKQTAEIRRQQAEAKERQSADRRAHREHVAEAAKGIDFN